jgi:2-haloacid dehalogenase
MHHVVLDDFEVLTFDCYGTLIDWERGILAALRQTAPPGGWALRDEELLERFAIHESAAEAGSYIPYREVLNRAIRGIAADCWLGISDDAASWFAASVAEWPPFPDSTEALRRLAGRYRMGVVTNCDEDLFAASSRRLGVRFDWVVTAKRVRSYKPRTRHFEAALATIPVLPERILHVAQSLYHDHVPAKALGLTTVWIDRRAGRAGSGATPLAEARPDLVFTSLTDFTDAALLDPRRI